MLALSFKAGECVFVNGWRVVIESIEVRRRRVLIATPFSAMYLTFQSSDVLPGVGMCITRFKSGTVVTLGFQADKSIIIEREAEVAEDVCGSPEVGLGNE